MMNPPQPLPRSAFISPHRIMSVAAAALLIFGILGALVWEVLRVTTPPELTVSAPADNFLTTEHSVLLEGHAAPESVVTVNGAGIALGTDGTFKEPLDLRTGLNIITISASKKFAAPRVIYRRVVVSVGTDASVDR